MGLHEEEVKRLIRQQWKPDLDSIMEDGGKLASGYAAEITTERDTLRAQLKASQADVKLLREAASILLGVIDAGKIMRLDCYPIVDMKAALTATAPKGEQGCQSKS